MFKKNINNSKNNTNKKLEDEAAELKTILNHIPMGLYWKNTDLTYKGCNSQFEKLSNIQNGELPGKTDADLHTKETAELFRKEDMEFLNGDRKNMYFTDKHVPMKNSSSMWARTYKIPIYDDDSNIKYIMGLIQDVTKIKQDEIALRESENRLNIVLNSTDDYIAFMDSMGKILVVNGSFLNDINLNKNDVVGKCINELFTSPLSKKMQNYIEASVRTSKPQRFNVKPDESQILSKYLDVSVYPVVTENKIIGAAIYAKDITDLKQTEEMLIAYSEQLKAAITTAQHANKSKSEFLSRMSHEIRTPIGAITGMAKIASDTDDLNKIKDCLKKIDSSSKHLLGIINDVLDMSKIEADKFILSPTVFRFENMLQDVINVVCVQADEKNLEFEVIFSDELPEYFNADELRLRQVITNLLSNAIKFTPEHGNIQLKVSNLGVTDDIAGIEITVMDSGIGMTPEQQLKLFEPFEQAEGGISRKYGGTGLGLSICKKIVEIMGGQIWIESGPDSGSKVAFQVKMKVHRDDNERSNKIVFSDMRALIVDDSFETREYLSHILKKFGIHSKTAKDGLEAVEMVTEATNTNDEFNIFFVDWSMPGINGIETTKRIKSMVNDNAIVIMISITAWETIEKQAIQAGVSSFIAKPLFPSNVLNVLNEIAGTPVKNNIQQGDTGIPDLSGYNILLVEDMDINREIAAALLKPTQVEIDFALNGTEAVDKYNNNKGRYDLILMDIHMPGTNGYEATRLIRSSGDILSLNIPIVAMTADAFNEDIEKCITAGMNDHVAKPINEAELYKKITKYGVPYHQNKSLRELRTKKKYDDDDLLYIDEKDAVNRLNGDRELYIKLLESFLKDETYLNIKKNIDIGDIQSAQRAMHAIKGMAANLSLNILYKAAAITDEMLKQNIIKAETIQHFESAMNTTINAIESFLILK